MEHNTDQPYEFAVHHSEEEGKKARKVIWIIFWVLLIITGAEVGLGLTWKNIGVSWGFVKTTFIVLTLAKAYFIVVYYMHLKHEWKNLKITLIVPYVFFAIYLILLVLNEAVYSNAMDNWLW